MDLPYPAERYRGAYIGLRGHVWWCGDEWCDCTQAQLVAVWRNAFDSRFIWTEGVWEGTFYSDGESGASAELATVRAALAEHWPEVEQAVEWRDNS